MPHRDFERREREPVSFSFDGQMFRCIEAMPWALLEEILGKVPTDARGQVIEEASNVGLTLVLGDFFRQVVVVEGLPGFEEVLRRKQNPLDVATLTAIVQWLVEVYTGRPTERPGSSQLGPSVPETKSRVVSLQPGTVEEVG